MDSLTRSSFVHYLPQCGSRWRASRAPLPSVSPRGTSGVSPGAVTWLYCRTFGWGDSCCSAVNHACVLSSIPSNDIATSVSCPRSLARAEEGSPGFDSQCWRARDDRDPHLLNSHPETTAACGALQLRQGGLVLSLGPHRAISYSFHASSRDQMRPRKC